MGALDYSLNSHKRTPREQEVKQVRLKIYVTRQHRIQEVLWNKLSVDISGYLWKMFSRSYLTLTDSTFPESSVPSGKSLFPRVAVFKKQFHKYPATPYATDLNPTQK